MTTSGFLEYLVQRSEWTRFHLAVQEITVDWFFENKTYVCYLLRQVAAYVCTIGVNYLPFPLAVIRNTLHS